MKSWHDKFIERGIVILIVFAPYAFAAVPVWSLSIMQLIAFVVFGIWLHKASSAGTLRLRGAPVIATFALFALLVLLQLVPLPPVVLARLSPVGAQVYRMAEGEQSAAWHPVSLHPQETLSGLVSILAYAAVFTVVANSFGSRRDLTRAIRVLAVSACVLVLVAWIQRMTWNGRLYWFYPIDPILQEREGSIWGPYINRNHFAGYLELIAPLVLGLMMYRLSRIHWHGRGMAARMAGIAGDRRLPEIVMLFLAFALLSGTLFATLSRGGILGYASSMILFAVLLRSRRAFRKWSGALAVAGMVIMTVGVFASWERIERRFLDASDVDSIPRVHLWTDLTGMVRDFPLTGAGLGSFDHVFPRYQTRHALIHFEHAENDYLEILTDTGIPGLCIALAAAGVYYVTALKQWRTRKSSFAVSIGAAGMASSFALAVHSLTDFNLRVPANAMILSVIAGLTLAAISRDQQEETAPRSEKV